MPWVDEAIAWLSERFVYNEVGRELDRMAARLREGDVDSRLSAIKQLQFMKSADAEALLIGALRDGDRHVRQASATALAYRLSREAVPPLAVLLDDPEAEVRIEAVRALDEIGLPRAERIARGLKERLAAPPPDPRVPDLLGRALLDTLDAVREAALAALPRHGAGGVEMAVGHVEGLEAGARDSGIHSVEPELVAALAAKEPAHRKAAVTALHRLLGERAVRPLAEALKDPSAEVRSAAVDAVTALGPRPALEELLTRLSDPDEGVAVKVIEGLVCQRNLETFDAGEEERIHAELLRVARFGQGRARRVAAWALGQLARVDAVATLCELLGQEDVELVVAACDALGRINDPRAIGPLLSLLSAKVGDGTEPAERPAGLRIAAIRALALAGDVRAVPRLVTLLFSESRPPVEAALEKALGTLCHAAETAAQADLASPDAARRLAAIRRAVSEPRLALGLLGQVLEGPTREVRSAAREVLRKQGLDVEALVRSALAPADKSATRRILAVNLAAGLDLPDAAPLLGKLLKDPDEPPEVYRHTVAALRRLGEAGAGVLREQGQHPREDVRRWIAEGGAPATP